MQQIQSWHYLYNSFIFIIQPESAKFSMRNVSSAHLYQCCARKLLICIKTYVGRLCQTRLMSAPAFWPYFNSFSYFCFTSLEGHQNIKKCYITKLSHIQNIFHIYNNRFITPPNFTWVSCNHIRVVTQTWITFWIQI